MISSAIQSFITLPQTYAKFRSDYPIELFAWLADLYIKHRSLPHFLGCIRSWSAVNHYQRQHNEDPVIKLGKQLNEFWSDAEQSIHWVLTVKICQR